MPKRYYNGIETLRAAAGQLKIDLKCLVAGAALWANPEVYRRLHSETCNIDELEQVFRTSEGDANASRDEWDYLRIEFPTEEDSEKGWKYTDVREQIQPLDRGAKYEDPLDAALKKERVGEVSGGGTQLSAPDADGKKSIEWVGVDVDLSDFDKGMPKLKRELLRLGAPAATVLAFTRDGKSVEEKLR